MPAITHQGPRTMDEPVLEQTETRYASTRARVDIETWRCRGESVERPVIHHPGAVGIIVQPDPDHLLLVRQYRYPVRRWTLEIPAGTCEVGEDPAATALRELEEEAGVVAGHLVELCRLIPAIGISDEELIIYRAEEVRPGRAAPDSGEAMAAEIVAIDDLAGLRREGLICDGKTLVALALIGRAEVLAC